MIFLKIFSWWTHKGYKPIQNNYIPTGKRWNCLTCRRPVHSNSVMETNDSEMGKAKVSYMKKPKLGWQQSQVCFWFFTVWETKIMSVEFKQLECWILASDVAYNTHPCLRVLVSQLEEEVLLGVGHSQSSTTPWEPSQMQLRLVLIFPKITLLLLSHTHTHTHTHTHRLNWILYLMNTDQDSTIRFNSCLKDYK